MTDNILVYNPTAKSQLKMKTVRLNRPDLKGLNLGVIDNGKPNFDVLAGYMLKILCEKYGGADVIYKKKKSSAIPALDADYQEMAAHCDLVITGAGD